MAIKSVRRCMDDESSKPHAAADEPVVIPLKIHFLKRLSNFEDDLCRGAFALDELKRFIKRSQSDQTINYFG